MLGSLNHVTHELIVHTSPTKRSSDFVAHLEQIDALYGPVPGRASKPDVLVEDNGPIHVSKLSRAALAARSHWLTVEWLSKYTPELNDIEVVWHDLKAIIWLIRHSLASPNSMWPFTRRSKTSTASGWSFRWPSRESLLSSYAEGGHGYVGVSRVLASRADCFEPQIRMATMKACILAAALDGRVIGAGDLEISRAVHPAEATREGDVAIAVSPDTIRILGESRAKVALVPEGTQFPHERFETMIIMRRSRSSLPAITQIFRHRPEVHPGIHPSAVVASGAVIGEGATIGPLVVIGPGASVGARSVILSQATLAAGATLGADCLVYPGVRIGWGCRVGDRAVLHHNVSIGADGFSFVPMRAGALEAAQGAGGAAPTSAERNELQKIHTLSTVEIGDDVELGALTSIDRGTLKPTRIGAGTKIDDLVMIGHNVEIGLDCLLCGQVGLAGGVIIGDGAVLGGRVGVADHLKIGAWAVVGAAACVGTNVPAGAVYAGYPAVPRAEAMENLKMMRRVRRLVASTGRGQVGRR